MFALVMGRTKRVSPSIDPDDQESSHYDGGLQAAAVHKKALEA